MPTRINAVLRRIPRGAVWLAGLIPLGLLVLDTVQGRLGVDPLAAIEHRTGRTAVYFLVAGLCVTPLLRIAGINLMRFRRALGMLGFLYAALHVVVWAVLDRGLIWSQIIGEILHRPFVTIGAASMAVLVVLAATASDFAIRRLGSRCWRRIHWGVYAAVPLAGWHWLLSEKVPGMLVHVILFVVLVLLGFRVWFSVRRRVVFGG